MVYAPIVIFCYNRAETLKTTVESLLRNPEARDTDVFVYSDAAKNQIDIEPVTTVRKFLQTVSGFKSFTIYEREKNYGLQKNIVHGVSDILRKRNSVIVMEDDIEVNENFLHFMHHALTLYETDEKVSSVSGFSYLEKIDVDNRLPTTYFIKGADCLAWATWASRWEDITFDAKLLLADLKRNRQFREFDRMGNYPYSRMLKQVSMGKANSWAICWYASNFLKSKYILFPRKSFARHIGATAQATNYLSLTVDDPYFVALSGKKEKLQKQFVYELPMVSKMYNSFLKQSRGTILTRIKFKFHKIWMKFKAYLEY